MKSFALAILLLFAAATSYANHPKFRQGLLTLPVVDDGGETWSLELVLQSDTFPPVFELTWSRRVFADIDINTPWFDGDYLIIPELRLGRESWWVELRQSSTDRFLVDSYGVNTDYRPGLPFLPTNPAWSDWLRVPGDARDIGVGADGSVWVLGGSVYDNAGFEFFGDGGDVDFGLWVLEPDGWLEVPGSGIRLDVDPDGYPWVINSNQEIWRLTALGWRRIPGRANDIGIGADGSVWALGTTERQGGYEIFRYTGFGWQRVHGTGVRIDVDPYGIPWIVNHDDDIFRLINGYWEELPGLAKDISVGADGSVWVIGSDRREGGYGIYRWDDYGWTRVRGSARQISVGPDGEPWVVNRDGEIYVRW